MKAFRVSLAAAIVWVLHGTWSVIWDNVSSYILNAVSNDYKMYLTLSTVAGVMEMAVTFVVLVLAVIALVIAAKSLKRDVEDRQKIWASVALGIALVLVIICGLSVLSTGVSTAVTYFIGLA